MMKWLKHSAVVALATAGLAALATASPASADGVGPAIKYFNAPLPVVGSVLSDSSSTPSFPVKDGWSVNDGDGIASAYTDLHSGPPTYDTTRVWNAPTTGASVTHLSGKYTWDTRVGGYNYLDTNATDTFGNTSEDSAWVYPSLSQENAGSFGRGWTTSACSCYSAGGVMKSSTVGAKATFTFSYSPLVSLVSDRAANRGKVSVSVDGGAPVTVDLSTGTPANRVIVWNSKYLNPNGSHLLTIKVVSGRVDIDGFLTQ